MTTGSAFQALAVAAVFRHAWRQLAYAASTYVFQAGFLVTLSVCVFVVAGLYESDFAALDILSSFLPWVSILLVPAFAMGAFSSNGSDRELELMFTMPLSDLELVLGKWLAGSALLLITLTFTAPIALTVAYLGSPDTGTMAATTLGAALLLITYYGLSLFAAALTREQTSAYVLAAALLMLVTLSGSNMAARALPSGLLDALGNLSPKRNFDRLATGRIELAVLVNFGVLIGLAIWGATEAVAVRRTTPVSALHIAANVGIAAVALIVAVALTTFVSTTNAAVDLTGQRQYTLSQATIDAARQLPPGATLELYWTEAEPSVPARIRAHAHQVERIAASIARQSNGHLTFIKRDTAPDTDAEWTALSQGVRRVPMSSGDSFLLGLVLRQGDRQQTFDYLDADRAQSFEYDLALALTKLSQYRLPKIGLISPLFTPSNITEPRDGLSILQDLKRSADVAIIPFFADALPDDLDVVIVLGGALMKPSMLSAIDQHAMRGKGLIVCLDPHTRFNPASDAAAPVLTRGGIETLPDLLNAYGIRYEARVTGDAKLAATILGEDQQTTTYPFWLRVPRAQISSAHPATAKLNELAFVEPGSLTLAAASTAVALVTTSDKSGTLAAADFNSSSPSTLAAKFQSDGVIRTLVAFVTGPLISAYPTLANSNTNHLLQRTASSAIFVVADVDWLFDPAAVDGAGTSAARPLNDNHAFLANMIDVASRDVRLLDVRTRGNVDRRFTRVEHLLVEARARFRAEENDVAARIAKVETTVAQIVTVAHVKSTADLPANIRAEIDKLNVGLIPVRRRLRDLRRHMREEVEALGFTLTIANIASGPLLVLAFAGLVFRSRLRMVPTRAAVQVFSWHR